MVEVSCTGLNHAEARCQLTAFSGAFLMLTELGWFWIGGRF